MTTQIHGHDIVTKALEYRGVPYVWGGNDEKGWDCSGYVLFILRYFELVGGDMTAHDIWLWCSTTGNEFNHIDECRGVPGSLIFIRGGDGRISHVGFCDGRNNSIEARGKNFGTGVWPWRKSWNCAAKVPGVYYTR